MAYDTIVFTTGNEFTPLSSLDMELRLYDQYLNELKWDDGYSYECGSRSNAQSIPTLVIENGPITPYEENVYYVSIAIIVFM